MKIQVTFNYDGVDYRYTVDEEQVEMAKYDNVWCVGLFSRYNEFDPQKHMKETRDKDLFFKVIADKRFIDGKSIISGDNLRVLVYDRYDETPLAIITNGENNLDIQYA
jgi:hypothetical protein